MKKVKLLLSKVRQSVLKFLSFFIPYIKRKMERATIIREISNLMNPESRKYTARYVSDMISQAPMNVHQLTYHVDLNSGILVIDLNYDQGIFSHKYQSSETSFSGVTTADFKELYEVGTYFDSIINPVRMIELFEKLK